MTGRVVDVAGVIAGAFAYGYAAGRTRPLHRLYDWLDYANDRAIRGWRKGDRLWTICVGFIALHPFRFTASALRVKRDAHAERRAEREAAKRWQDGDAARKPPTERLDTRP